MGRFYYVSIFGLPLCLGFILAAVSTLQHNERQSLILQKLAHASRYEKGVYLEVLPALKQLLQATNGDPRPHTLAAPLGNLSNSIARLPVPNVEAENILEERLSFCLGFVSKNLPRVQGELGGEKLALCRRALQTTITDCQSQLRHLDLP